jgi:hypothetical protein
LDINEGIVEQAKFLGIHIIRMAELKNIPSRLLERAFLIKVHHRCDGDTVPIDGPPGGFQHMLTEFKAHFGKSTYTNS